FRHSTILIIVSFYFFLLITPPPPRSTLFPYTTLFRSWRKTSIESLKRNFLWPAMGAIAVGAVLIVVGIRPWRDMMYLYSLMTIRSEEHTSELQSRGHLVCRLLLEKKNKIKCELYFTLR